MTDYLEPVYKDKGWDIFSVSEDGTYTKCDQFRFENFQVAESVCNDLMAGFGVDLDDLKAHDRELTEERNKPVEPLPEDFCWGCYDAHNQHNHTWIKGPRI